METTIRDNVGSLDLPTALAGGDWMRIREHAVRIAARCHPLRSQAIIAVIPEGWELSIGGIYLPERRGRRCKIGLVLRAHPEIYGETRVERMPTSLKTGDVVVFLIPLI